MMKAEGCQEKQKTEKSTPDSLWSAAGNKSLRYKSDKTAFSAI